MTATSYIDIERPEGWLGESFDSSKYDEQELDDFEIEVEGQVRFYTDHYGADADGNRGMYVDHTDVEDLNFTLYGDFRPFYIKVRDYFLLKWKNRRIFKPALTSYHLLPPRPVKWQQLSDYDHINLSDTLFDSSEIEDAIEKLTQEAEERCEPDPDEYYEQKREDRAREEGGW